MKRLSLSKLPYVKWLYVGLLAVGLLFALAACQPVTIQPQRGQPATPTLIEHKIPTHNAHANGIKVGADGAIWFAESGANQIGRISMDGVVTEYEIPTEDALDDRQGFVALGPDGAIWFNEDLVNKLGRIALDGTITEFDLPDGTNGIREMVAGPDGALWVTASGAGKIMKLSTEAEVLAEYTLPNPASNPVGMVVGPDGAFWFVENGVNQIGRITVDGELTEYALPTENSVPLRMTVGPDNALWFTLAGANKIGRISLDGEVTEFDAAGMQPVGIAAGADGAIWFTGYRSTEIGRLTVDGVLTKIAVPTYAAVPYHIVAGPDGNLWFTQQQSNLIGQIILPAATAAEQPASAPTTFTPKLDKTPLSFDFDVEWHVDDNLPGMVTLTNQQGFSLSFYVVSDGQLVDPLDGQLIPFPEDFLAWIQSNPDFDAVESSAVTVGGIEGVQIDATPIWKSTTSYLKPLLALRGDGWANGENIVNEPEQWRFTLLNDVKGERLLIILIDEDGENFEAAVGQAQEVLDSVVFSNPTTLASEIFNLPMSVTFGDEWSIAEEDADLITLVGPAELAFILVGEATRIADAQPPFSRIPFPEDFATWIEAQGLFEIVNSQPIVVGGMPGIQFDANGSAACADPERANGRRNWIFLSRTGWNCMPAEHWRFIYLDDVNGERILIINSGGPATDEEFNLGAQAAQKVLDSVTFSAR